MKSKMKSKGIAVVMALAMVFAMMPIMGAPVYAASKSNFYSGADVLQDGSNTPEAATVHMAGTKWLVIGYGVSQEGDIPQVASSADTMTLITGDNLKTGVQFNPYDNQVNTYKDSNLYNEVNALTDHTNGIFSKGEKEGIVSRDLEPGDYTDSSPYTNGIAGDKVENALLWPLSTQEANYMDSELLRASYYWWLRSPGGYYNDNAAVVSGDGLVYHYGLSVSDLDGVRPAFNFNLKSVIFTSAAAGGKSSGTVGADSLSKVSEYMSGKEWKLTLKDGAHEDFKVNKVTKAGDGKLKIEYGDAAADGEKEYISAIVKTSAGGGEQFASWYGKLALAQEASGTNNPSCELTIPKNLEAGDEIYVFNEQCNADATTTTPAETDYASEPIKVYTAPNPKITEQPVKELKLTYGDTTGNVLSVKAEVATGNTLSYQWYYKDSPSLVSGTKIDNATGDSYTVPTDENVGKKLYYYCVVTEKDQYGVEMSSKSNQAAVTVDKAQLTIKPKDQTFTYNGQLQGPGDIVYEGTEVDEYVDYDKSSLKFNDKLSSITIDGQGQDIGEYPLTITGYMINANGGKGDNVKDNYDITYEAGILHITRKPDPKPTSNVSGTPLVRMTTKGDNSLVVSWNKIQGADGHDVYFAYCGETSKYAATVKGNKTFSWTKSGLKKGRCYKAYVKAYVMRNGKKTFVKCSPLVHAYASGGSTIYTSAKAVKVEKASANLKAGQAFQIKPSIEKLNKNKYLMPKKFAPTFRYMSSNEKVATVSSGGKVTAKGKGTCYIYVFAHNGVSKQVRITVK